MVFWVFKSLSSFLQDFWEEEEEGERSPFFFVCLFVSLWVCVCIHSLPESSFVVKHCCCCCLLVVIVELLLVRTCIAFSKSFFCRLAKKHWRTASSFFTIEREDQGFAFLKHCSRAHCRCWAPWLFLFEFVGLKVHKLLSRAGFRMRKLRDDQAYNGGEELKAACMQHPYCGRGRKWSSQRQ